MFLVAQTLLPSTVNWRDRGAIAANHLDVAMRRIVLTGGSAFGTRECRVPGSSGGGLRAPLRPVAAEIAIRLNPLAPASAALLPHAPPPAGARASAAEADRRCAAVR